MELHINHDMLKQQAPERIKELNNLKFFLLEREELRNKINTLVENRIGESGTTIEIENLRTELEQKDVQFNEALKVKPGLTNFEAIDLEIKRWQNILEN